MNNENILVALDASQTSIDVLKRAVQLSKIKKYKLTLLHVVNQSMFENFFPQMQKENITQSIYHRLASMLEEANASELEYSIEIKEGNTAETILEMASNINACLIVLGANSKDDFTDKQLGSTAYKVAKKSVCPILFIKNFCDKPYEQILGFTDLTDTSRKTMQFSKAFFDFAKIKLVHAYKQLTDFAITFYNANHDKETARKQVKEQAQKVFETFRNEVDIEAYELLESFYNINDVLLEISKKENAKLVILSSQGIGGVSSVLNGSVSVYLLETLESDVFFHIA
ncbi:universal stress protein [Candidatus Marinarcus aquaticus]|nr:universal stress protein [Candidatus Marinarcus aquaticus]